MDHSFIPHQLDSTKCGQCNFAFMAHTSLAECDVCPTIGPVEIFCDLVLCPECLTKEKESNARLTIENNTLPKQEERVNTMNAILSLNQVLDKARTIDQTIQVRTDLFNAETVAITELKTAIDDDPNIENKNYALAEELNIRYQHLKKVIFEMSEEIVAKQNTQRAIQQYLNTLSNQLHVAEREKLKLQDIKYQPEAIKISKPRLSPSTKKKSYDKAGVRAVALELGFPEIVVQMTCTKHNMTAEQAKVFLLNRKNDIGM